MGISAGAKIEILPKFVFANRMPTSSPFNHSPKLRLLVTSDDQDKSFPSPLEFRHTSIGTSSFNTVFSSSRLLLPVLTS
jgi:uncharacterized protein